MKILVDTNILLDVALQQVPHLADSDRMVNWCRANPGSDFIAWHTVATVYYFVDKEVSDAEARQFIATLLGIFEIVKTGTAHARHALTLPMRDYEDALQAAAAVQAGVDYIVTRDRTDFRNSPIPPIEPAAFLALS